MTAGQINRSSSDNSGSRGRLESEYTVTERDPRLRKLVSYVHNRGISSIAEIAAEAGWLLDTVRERTDRLERENYVQKIEDCGTTLVLLTDRGEKLAREASR